MGNVTTLTRKGQVTIPKAIREELGLKPFDKIEIYLEDGEAKLRKAFPSLEEVAGSIPAIDVPLDEAFEIAHEEIAQRYADKFLR